MSAWLTTNKEVIMLWIGAFCTLGLYSVLYKENKIYRFFEHLFLGLATGYLIENTWTDVLLPKWWEPMLDGSKRWSWAYIFALPLGLCFYFIYSKKNSWIARMVIGFFLGVGAGQTFQGFVGDTWPQIVTSFRPVIAHDAIAKTAAHPAIKALGWPDAINNLIFLIVLLCVMSYFFFSFEQKHPVIKGSAKLGRWLMMFSFGAIFGSTIMARLALLIDRMDSLMNDFGGRVFGFTAGPIIMFIVLIILSGVVLALVYRDKNKTEEFVEP
jgi:hypothetical protein